MASPITPWSSPSIAATLTKAVQDLAHAPPDRGFTFIRPNDQQARFLSHAELASVAEAMSHALASAAVGKADTVALVLTDPEEFVVTFLATVLLGAVPTPLYPPFATSNLEAYLDRVRAVITRGSVRALVVDEAHFELLSSFARGDCTVTTLSRLRATPPRRGPTVDVSPDDVAFLQFTSGSTSVPKGVLVTHGNLAANVTEIYRSLEMTDATRPTSWLPLYHDMGLVGFVLLPVFCRLSAVLIPTESFLRRPTCWLATVSKHRGTITFAPNFAFALATRATKSPEELDLSCLRVVGCAAEPIHPDTLAAFGRHFARAGLAEEALVPSYGMAEATLAISFADLHTAPRRDRIAADAYRDQGAAIPTDDSAALEFVSCGTVIAGHELVVVDPHGSPVAERTVGEIVVRGPSVARGYKNDADASQTTFTPLGLRTGDLGYLAEGEVFVTGRQKDILVVNGRKYDPHIVESLVERLPRVQPGNVVAFSVRKPATEEVVVVVQARADDVVQLQSDIKALAWNTLQLRISDVVVAAPKTIPKTTSGKLRRSTARDMYLTDVNLFLGRSRA